MVDTDKYDDEWIGVQEAYNNLLTEIKRLRKELDRVKKND